MTSRTQLGDEMLRRLAAAVRSAQLYSHGHPLIARNLDAFGAALKQLHDTAPSVVIGIVNNEVIVDEAPIKGDTHGGLVRRLKQIGVEKITVDRGVTSDEITTFVDAVTRAEPTANGEAPALPASPHIRVGRVSVEEEKETAVADMASFKQLYSDAVSGAEVAWESAKTEGQVDATAARTMVDGLAQAVSQNRTALMALTTLKNYDNYTFTHMVNVSLLTMGQARALGIDGGLLREFGLAALMHDIGKVRTPLEILNKPSKLNEAEFKIMQRHTVDGAEILRSTPDVPTLAPVVAFEHHLRPDGSGYPSGVQRKSLNLGTTLCSIADVFDAMRSQRKYQEAFASDRVLEILKRNDGKQFDQHLVRRFAQLIGIYPAGTLVRLNTGETAVVLKVYAPDTRRPRVRVVMDPDGGHLETPYDVSLWTTNGHGGPSSIEAPLDPAVTGIDPLFFL